MKMILPLLAQGESGLSCHERFRAFHQTTSRHIAIDDSAGAGGLPGLFIAARLAAAAGGFPDDTGVGESARGATSVTLQFELNRDINGAARDVQAAINAARGQLPANLPSNPNYRKVNPADAPILLLSLTSDTVRKSALYDLASTVLAQKIAQ